MSSAPRPKTFSWTPLALLLLLALLAWWPLLTLRPAVADDYLFAPVARTGVGEYWRIYGIWRLAGHPVPFLVKQLVPSGDAIAALLIHLTTVALLYVLLGRLVASRALQMAAALFFAVMPFGFQALTWNSALSFALSTLFALAALLASLRPVENARDGLKVAALVGLLGLLSLSANEATLLLIAWIAFYQIILAGWPGPNRGRWLVALSLVLCEGLWVVVHLATRATYIQKHVAVHLPSVLSGLLRQYEQASYLWHLPRLGAWMMSSAWISAGVAVLLLLALWPYGDVIRQRLPRPQIAAFALLPLAAVTVYALGGGFSLDARKAYPIWAFLLLAGAWFLQAAPQPLQRVVFALTLAFAPLLVLSSHTTTRAWQQTAHLFELASTQINDRHLPGPYAFRWQPDVYTAWPDFERLCGFRFDDRWMMDYPIEEGALRPGSAQTTLEWQPATATWKVVPQTLP